MVTSILTTFKEIFLMSKKFIIIVFLTLFFIYLFSGIYSVEQNQVGVVQRFGKIIDDKVKPGIHFGFPWPVDKIYKVTVKKINRIFVNDFISSDDEINGFYFFTGLEPYCITGDNNIVNISCKIQYFISNPTKYLINYKNPDNILYELTCSNIIHCLAKRSVDEILTYGKKDIENYLRSNLQKKLDRLECGLSISFVELEKVTPPDSVKSFFDDVINAKINKNKMVSKAESYWNEKIPQANSQANYLINEALSYEHHVVNKAKGESERFLEQLSLYAKTIKVSKKRLYLDYLNEILSNLDKIHIISETNSKLPAEIRIMNAE